MNADSNENILISRIVNSDKLNQSPKSLLLALDRNEIEYFSFTNIEKIIGRRYKNLHRKIFDLHKQGFLMKLENGKYCLPSFNDNFVIGTFLLENSAIAYWSALNYWNLTEQIPNTVFVQSPVFKKSKKIRNVEYKFVKVTENKFIGITSVGRVNHKFRITDIEKTLIDCFDLPQYAGGFSELIRAFYEAKINVTKLTEYAIKVNNLTAMKRISYLAELFEFSGYKRFHRETQKRLKDKYTYFSPFANKDGKYLSRWKLCLNIEPEKIQEIVRKTY